MSALDVQFWSGALAACVVLGIVILGAWLTLRDKNREIAALKHTCEVLDERIRELERFEPRRIH